MYLFVVGNKVMIKIQCSDNNSKSAVICKPNSCCVVCFIALLMGRWGCSVGVWYPRLCSDNRKHFHKHWNNFFHTFVVAIVFFCTKVVMAADFMFQPRVCKYVCIYFFILYICTYIYRYCGMYVVVKKNLCWKLYKYCYSWFAWSALVHCTGLFLFRGSLLLAFM